MNRSKRSTELVIFCINNTAARLGISGSELYEELKRSDGIKSFLYPSYATFHTQGKEYIVDETLKNLSMPHPVFLPG